MQQQQLLDANGAFVCTRGCKLSVYLYACCFRLIIRVCVFVGLFVWGDHSAAVALFNSFFPSFRLRGDPYIELELELLERGLELELPLLQPTSYKEHAWERSEVKWQQAGSVSGALQKRKRGEWTTTAWAEEAWCKTVQNSRAADDDDATPCFFFFHSIIIIFNLRRV